MLWGEGYPNHIHFTPIKSLENPRDSLKFLDYLLTTEMSAITNWVEYAFLIKRAKWVHIRVPLSQPGLDLIQQSICTLLTPLKHWNIPLMEAGISQLYILDASTNYIGFIPWLPDGYSRILRSYVIGPSGFLTMAPLRYTAKFDPFLSLDFAPTPSTLVQSKERKGWNFAIWQPW